VKITKVRYTDRASEDLKYWAMNEPVIFSRVQSLVAAAMKDPSAGIGKPEKLKHDLAGYWSRRITGQHRLVYMVNRNELVIIQARFHSQ